MTELEFLKAVKDYVEASEKMLKDEVDSETAIEYLKQYEAEWVAGTYSIEAVLREICEDFPNFVLPAVLQMLADVKCQPTNSVTSQS